MEKENGKIRDLLLHGYRYALALTHDRAQAEDIVQDVALRVSRFDHDLSRFGFLRAVKNRYIDELRRQGRRPGIESFDAHGVDPQQDEADAEWEAPLDCINGALSGALEQLRPEERGIVYLSAVEGMSAQQIADLMSWPRSTVLSMLIRGRAKLRRQLRRGSD